MDKGTGRTPSKKTPSTPVASTESPPIISAQSSYVSGVEGVLPYQTQTDELYMSENQLGHFKHILELMRQNLMEEVDRTVSTMREDAYKSPDLSDEASRAEQTYTDLTTRTREGKLLKKIEGALNRIEHHDYGYCDNCGIEIGIRRLEARPTATLCIDCKTLDEIREKQRGG